MARSMTRESGTGEGKVEVTKPVSVKCRLQNVGADRKDIYDSFMAKRKAKNGKIGFRSSLYKAMIELNMST